MPGHLVPRTWKYDPTMDAPAAYKRACQYEAFVPDELASLEVQLDATLSGLVSEAEHAIRLLNDEGGPALDPLARLLLRTESIASSKVEGLQLGVRELARAEAKAESGGKPSPTAMELLANIDAMLLAVDEAATVERFGVTEITAIHRRLLERAPHQHIAGLIRTQQNWIGGNDYNPCGADFVPPPAEDVDRLLSDICASINNETLSPLVQAALETGIIVTAEEHQIGGLANWVSHALHVAPALHGHPVAFGSIGVKDRFGESGQPWELMWEFEVSGEHIAAKAKELHDFAHAPKSKKGTVPARGLSPKPKKPAARKKAAAKKAKPAAE